MDGYHSSFAHVVIYGSRWTSYICNGAISNKAMLSELIDITAYDWDGMPPCGFFEVLGKRGTGKTSWTQYITQFSPTRSVGTFVVVAGSETAKASWSKIVHPIFVYDPEIQALEKICDTQSAIVKGFHREGTPVPPDRHVTVVLDDVSSNKKLMRSQVISSMASNSRHLNMSVFILVQYHCQIVSEVRNQFDTVFMLNTADKRSIERVHAEYCSVVDLRVFKHVMGHVTKDFGMLVIDNRSTDPDIKTICFYASMASYPPVIERLGAPELWEWCEDHYGDPDEPRPDPEDADEWEQSSYDPQKTSHTITDRRGRLTIRKV